MKPSTAIRSLVTVATLATVTFVALVSPVHAAEKPAERIPVLVRGGGEAEGFTDPSKDRQDSKKDLLKKVKDSDWVRPAESEADALVILDVLDRETKRETNLWGRQNKSYLTVRLTAGEFTTEFTGESGSKGVFKGYGAAAAKIVKQLEEWVKTNREKLLSMKKESAPAETEKAPAVPKE